MVDTFMWYASYHTSCMGKFQQTSINLRPDQMEYMQEESINTSELIRKLLDQYMDGGADASGLELRLTELESRKAELELERENVEDQLEQTRQAMQRKEQAKEVADEIGGALMAQTHKRFNAYAIGRLKGNAAFTRWAVENYVSPIELREQYRQYRAALEDM